MELRRAILLFAIILGLAAIATSVQRPAPDEAPTERDRRPQPATPSASARAPATVPAPAEVSFAADLRPETESLPLDRAATLTVNAEAPGQVDIPRLGLTGYADRLAPARFEVLPSSAGRYEVFFEPTEEGPRRKIGIVEVTR